ncbi:hypothetical protein BKA56DRAFT_725587 [Ilyonectria sp. MPI-CAGE-AT-0026]|nr:hypothetical protein BKA56DRAFT_725587 [Ilyonectria sp. MPI-CAGE-AT-0026]
MKVVDKARKVGVRLAVGNIFRQDRFEVLSELAGQQHFDASKLEESAKAILIDAATKAAFAKKSTASALRSTPSFLAACFFLVVSPPYCRRCLDAAASWHPEKVVRAKVGLHLIEAPTSCSPVSGSASPKCSRCAKNGKPCEVLARGDRPILVNLFAFLAAGQFPKTKAEYLESPAVQAVRTPARRLLHRLKFGDKNARARSSAADAAAVAAREASEAAARVVAAW